MCLWFCNLIRLRISCSISLPLQSSQTSTTLSSNHSDMSLWRNLWSLKTLNISSKFNSPPHLKPNHFQKVEKMLASSMTMASLNATRSASWETDLSSTSCYIWCTKWWESSLFRSTSTSILLSLYWWHSSYLLFSAPSTRMLGCKSQMPCKELIKLKSRMQLLMPQILLELIMIKSWTLQRRKMVQIRLKKPLQVK